VALNRETFLKPIEVPQEKLYVPELEDHIWVKGMTAADRGKFEKTFETPAGTKSKRKMREIRERLIIACVCNEDGTALFTEDDIEAIGRQPITMIERIVVFAQKLSGFSVDEVEAMAKNSDGTEEDN